MFVIFKVKWTVFLSFGTAKNHGLKQMKNKRFKSMNVLNWKKGPSLFLLKQNPLAKFDSYYEAILTILVQNDV